MLKDCESVEAAYHAREMLRRAGIDCWLRQVYAGAPPSVEVAADQVEEPTLIAAEPTNEWQCENCGHEWREESVQ